MSQPADRHGLDVRIAATSRAIVAGMRIRTSDGKAGFLGYCANVHPGESLPDVLRAIRLHAHGVGRALGTDSLSLGLWLSSRSADALDRHGSAELSHALAAAGVFVVTLNGFPYGNFHAEVVKRSVYHPDLCSQERQAYLGRLARILAKLLPDDVTEGTISTLPIGHRAEAPDISHTPGSHGAPATAEQSARRRASEAAASRLCSLVEELARLRDRTGKSIRICLEPEPGCWLESTRDALLFFGQTLPDSARRHGVSSDLLSQHLGLCYDTCHQAIGFEDPQESIRALVDAGVIIGKAQLSSALELPNPRDPAARAQLATFEEPRFLHQVRCRGGDGKLWSADDLDQQDALPTDQPWRVHFHVPIHRESVGHVATTRPFLLAALPELLRLDPLPHLEVETYTWSVLPEAERPKTDADLVRGLASELAFVRDGLQLDG